jgi:hypothetical protein
MCPPLSSIDVILVWPVIGEWVWGNPAYCKHQRQAQAKMTSIEEKGCIIGIRLSESFDFQVLIDLNLT